MNIVDNESIAGSPLATIAMHSIKASKPLTLQMMPMNRTYMTNAAAEEIAWQRGALIASFGKGKFATREPSELTGGDLLFDLTDHTSLVVHNNILTTVGDVVKEKQKQDPKWKICYHDVEETAEGFKLTRKHHVVFVPQQTVSMQEGEGEEGGEGEGDGSSEADPSPNKATQANGASLIPATCWDTEVSGRVWTVAWRAKGLMPVRCQAVLLQSGTLPAGKSLVLTSP